jgi:hypothetical protein
MRTRPVKWLCNRLEELGVPRSAHDYESLWSLVLSQTGGSPLEHMDVDELATSVICFLERGLLASPAHQQPDAPPHK